MTDERFEVLLTAIVGGAERRRMLGGKPAGDGLQDGEAISKTDGAAPESDRGDV